MKLKQNSKFKKEIDEIKFVFKPVNQKCKKIFKKIITLDVP